MAVSSISSLSELQGIIQNAPSTKLIVLDFYADWCGPCRMIAPIFQQLAGQYKHAAFLKVNVDQARDVMMQYGVRAMPTFVFVKDKIEVDRLQGASEQSLEAAIRRHYTPSDSEANDNEKTILEQFTAAAKRAKLSTEPIRKLLAKSVIPDEVFELATIDGKIDNLVLLRELLAWFKNDFFTWVDSPTCKCGLVTAKGTGLNGTPTREELKLGASRVEIFFCSCGEEVRFPRYNDPAKLLETRSGRCGEWANCFSLILAAAGFEQRFVLDSLGDHVWNEVWISSQNRWMHVDPCENIMDQPLVYEKGWNKKLSYVLAFSENSVYDVTWRYAVNSMTAMARRRHVRPAIFTSFLTKLNARQQSNMTPQQKKLETQRRITELFEMIANEQKKNKDQNDYGGRTTGDQAWRTLRGESQMAKETKNEEIVVVSEQEISNGKFTFQYSSPTDEYKRGDTLTKGLTSFGTFKNITRKVEKDWKMTYLCRENGEEEGEVIWQFDLSKAKSMKNLTIDLKGVLEKEGANVFAMACLSELCMRIPKSGHLEVKAPESGILKVTISLSGGSGPNAFQNAQALRTDLGDAFEPTLSVNVEF